MMRQLSRLASGATPVLVAALAVLGLAYAAQSVPSAQDTPPEEPETTSCAVELFKEVTPERLLLGGTARVSMVISQTCPSERMPLDIIFLADASNSMTLERDRPGGVEPTPPGGGPIEPPPRRTPPTPEPPVPFQDPPEKTPAPDPGEPGNPGNRPGDEPAGCEAPRGPSEPGATTEPPGRETPVPPPNPDPDPPEPLLASGASLFQAVERALQDPPPTRTPPARSTPGNNPSEPVEPGGDQDLIREVKSFLRDFVKEDVVEQDIESGMLRLGLVSFNDRGRILTKLDGGQNALDVGRRASTIRGEGLTRIEQGVRTAVPEFDSLRGLTDPDAERRKVLVILSDGAFCNDGLRQARVGDDIDVVTVFFGRGGWERRLRQLASETRYHLRSREYQDFMDLYAQDLAKGTPVRIEEMTVIDELEPPHRLVAGSVQPPPSKIDGQRLEWWGVRPGGEITSTPRITITSPITLTYEIEPQEPGLWYVSKLAHVLSLDTEGKGADDYFPSVVIEVIEPTATPTATSTNTPTHTPTPTATPTLTPGPRYLPMTYRNWPVPPTATPEICTPEQQKVDVAIIVDASTSMSDPTQPGGQAKIDAAVGAAKTLVANLKLPQGGDADQATVVGFNNAATLFSQLSGNRTVIEAALDALRGSQDVGTRIDLGLIEARDELASDRARDGSSKSVVLVTDGRQDGAIGDQAVLDVAQDLRDAGVIVFTIGLGTDVDAALLQQVATEPDNYRHAPTTEDLELIYEEIAREIPCP